MSSTSIQESTSTFQSSCTKDERQNGYQCINSKSLNIFTDIFETMNPTRIDNETDDLPSYYTFSSREKYVSYDWTINEISFHIQLQGFLRQFPHFDNMGVMYILKFIITPILKCCTDYTILELSLHATVTAFSSATPGTAFCFESRLRAA